MLSRLVFFVVILTAQAFDLRDIVPGFPGLDECSTNFSMIDASGKIPNGMLSGNLVDLGNFDECLNIEEEKIKGKYCLVKLKLPPGMFNTSFPFEKNLYLGSSVQEAPVENRMVAQGLDPTDISTGIILGWCVPHTCPIKELTDYLSIPLENINPNLSLTTLLDGMCQTKDDIEIKYDDSSIIFITFLVATLVLMILSTAYDIYLHYTKQRTAHIILIAFSVKTNGQKLLTISNNSDQLGCVHGIRFLSMMWVIYGHRFSAVVLGPLVNLMDLIKWLKEPINMYILNAPVSVDTFFVLTGVLVSYGYCLAKERGIKFNIILFYVHRYLRLTPVYAVVIWFHATVIGYFGSGPFWPFALSVMIKDNCVKNWWAALLYIQNYYNNEQMCIGQSWYLSVDMQLFIIAPIILIPLWRWPKLTLITSGILVLGSFAISFAITFIKELPGFSINAMTDQDYNVDYYYTTHTRFGPWLMGLMLGYYLYKLKKKIHNGINLHPSKVAFGWIICMGLLLSTLFAGHGLLLHPTRLGASFFNGLHRHGWALGVCWVIYACTQGYGGPINAFLSWSVFQVLGRFTYTIYLVHLSMMYLMTASSRTGGYFSNFQIMHLFWGDFMFSLAIAFCLTLAYESPIVTIEKIIFKTGRKTTNPELPVHNNGTNSERGQNNKGFVEE